MGLNAGITVNFAEPQVISKDQQENLEDQFREHLSTQFPNAQGCFGSSIDMFDDFRRYDFDIRYVHYGDKFVKAGYEFEDMDQSIESFIRKTFAQSFAMEPYSVP